MRALHERGRPIAIGFVMCAITFSLSWQTYALGTALARVSSSAHVSSTLLLVGHHPSDVHTSMPRPDLPDMFFAAEELAAALDPHAWDVLVTDARPRPARDPQGREITIRDTVLVARRKPL